MFHGATVSAFVRGVKGIPNSMNYTGPRNGVTLCSRACAGLLASNVPIVVAKAIAWSSAARASCSNATPAASRHL